MELISLLYGIYPRSEELRKSYGKWERGKLSSEEIAGKIKEESDNFYNTVKEASLDYFTDPLFNWYDLFRPVALSIEGIKLGPLTRYKETNTFYRKPIIEKIGKLGAMENFREVEENPPFPMFHPYSSTSYIHFLPGINSLIKMSKTDGKDDYLIGKLKERYLEIVKRLGIERLLIYEPIQTNNLDIYHEIDDQTELYLVLTGGFDGTDEPQKKFHSIIGDDPYKLLKFCEIPGIKIVDAMNTKMQSGILERVKRYSDDFEKIIISNTESFDFLPRAIADKKLFSFKGETA